MDFSSKINYSVFPTILDKYISKTAPLKQRFSLKVISLREGEELLVEPGAMLAFKNLSMEVEKHQRGLLPSLKQYIFGGESLFVNRFKGQKGGGWLSLEEQYDGQIVEVSLSKEDSKLNICHGAFVAATANIDLNSHYEGFVGWWKGKGFGSIKANLKDQEEKGRVYICTDEGQVKAVRIEEGHPIIIDNEHILAYSPSLTSSIKKIGDLKSLLFGGEGFVTEFQGNGIVLIGSGAITGHSTWLTKFINHLWQSFSEEAIPHGVVLFFGVAGGFVGKHIYERYSLGNRYG